MPNENRVSIRLNTFSLPPRCRRVKVGSWVVYTEPINQNQEMPIIATHSGGWARVWRSKSKVLRTMCGSMRVLGALAATRGIYRLLACPSSATSIISAITTPAGAPATMVPRI